MNCEQNMEKGNVQPIYIVVEKSSNKKSLKESYGSKKAAIIGVLHIICGMVAFGPAVGFYFVKIYYGLHLVGTGIWSSVFFFITGGLSIGSARHTNSCLVICIMVMSIISAISAGILIIFSGIGLGTGRSRCSYYSQDCEIFLALNVLQLLAGITEMILAIISSGLSCKATCCRKKLDTSSPSRVMYRPTETEDHEQIVSLALQMDQSAPEMENIGTRGHDLLEYEQGNTIVRDGNSFGYKKF